MAVRNDFTAGEVLAAADLNDTFASKADYPSGGTDGDMLVKDGTSTDWVTPSVAGLTLITAESFSAVSSVSLNGCFSATYQNYRVMLYTVASGSLNLRWRFRVSGADNSNSSYERQSLEGNSTTAGASRATGQDHHNLGDPSTTDYGAHVFDIWRPFDASATAMTNVELRRAGPVLRLDNLQFTAATSFDGFTIYTSANNITGKVRVYGYKD